MHLNPFVWPTCIATQHLTNMAASSLSAVILPSSRPATASIIFMHGLGDTGHGWSPIGKQLARRFPYCRFIFPHAPKQPVTLNFGMSMPSWYDIYSLSDHTR